MTTTVTSVTTVVSTVDPKLVGAQLQSARKEQGLTQEQVGEKLSMARTTVIAIEKGERKVSGEELVQFAALYGKKVAEIVRVPVTRDDFTPQFRISERSDDTETDASIAAKELSRLAKAYMELEVLTSQPLQRRYPAPYPLDDFKISMEQAAENCAGQERNRFGAGDGPLLDLRSRLENDVGLRIFAYPMKGRLAGVFGYTDSMGGCIAINSDQPRERRRWSLAHEYGHFLSTRYDVDYDALGNRGRSSAEKFADNFAKHFLMPSSGLNRMTSEIQMRNGQLTLADVCTLAERFEVSLQSMVLRLEELKRIKSGTWDSLTARGFKVKQVKEYLGIKKDESPEEKFPIIYKNLTVLAYQAKKITEGQFAEYLGVTRAVARAIYQRAMEKLISEEKEGFGVFDADLKEVLS